MSEAIEAEGRLRAWIRDFGHMKEPPFIRDLTTVLDELAIRRKIAEYIPEPTSVTAVPGFPHPTTNEA